jgi:hypothetical protein
LAVSGALNYGGALVVTNLGGTLAGGDAFALFQANAFNGNFSSFSLPPLSAGLVWNTNALGNDLLTVVQTAPTNLLWAVSGTSLSLSWPFDHIGWRLQVQTNSLNVGLGANWVDVPGSSLTNNLVVPVDSGSGSIFYRLVY